MLFDFLVFVRPFLAQQGLTKTYGVDLLCSQSTMKLVPDFVYREIDKVRVKGKETPVTLYEPFYPNEIQLSARKKEELELNSLALGYYRGKRWGKAEEIFLELRNKSEKPSRYNIFLDRVSFYAANPPPDDWDGVFDHLTK